MRKQNDKEEHIEVLSSGSVPEVECGELASPRFRGSAVVPNPDAEAAAPKPSWYRVIKGGTVLENGFRTRMKEGKEINNINYNIRRLQQQGIVLQEFDPDSSDLEPAMMGT